MENEKITMALWLMCNKSSTRGMKQRLLLPSQMYITDIPHAEAAFMGRAGCPSEELLFWFLQPLDSFFLFFLSSVLWRERTCLRHVPWSAHGDANVSSALPFSLSGGAAGKSAADSGMALSFIKFIEFFTNGWTQFPSNFLIMQICKISNLDQFKTATAPNLPV